MCVQKPYSVCFCAGVRAILYNVNIASLQVNCKWIFHVHSCGICLILSFCQARVVLILSTLVFSCFDLLILITCTWILLSSRICLKPYLEYSFLVIKGGFTGWPKGSWPPLFLWKFVLFLLNSQKNKKYLYSWQAGKCSGHPFLNFLDTPLSNVRCYCVISGRVRDVRADLGSLVPLRFLFGCVNQRFIVFRRSCFSRFSF